MSSTRPQNIAEQTQNDAESDTNVSAQSYAEKTQKNAELISALFRAKSAFICGNRKVSSAYFGVKSACVSGLAEGETG